MVSNRFSHQFSVLALASIAVLSLSACTSVDDMPRSNTRSNFLSTQSMPKGYRYQDNTPLSSPQPSSPWVNSAVIHDTDKMSSSTAAWQGAVYELVAKMEPHLPKDGTPLNMAPIKDGSPDNNTLDHYLRQALIQRGYNLTTIPDAGLQLSHQVAKSKTDKTNDKTYNISMSVLDLEGKAVATEIVPAVLP